MNIRAKHNITIYLLDCDKARLFETADQVSRCLADAGFSQQYSRDEYLMPVYKYQVTQFYSNNSHLKRRSKRLITV
jgi:hypothetical protein